MLKIPNSSFIHKETKPLGYKVIGPDGHLVSEELFLRRARSVARRVGGGVLTMDGHPIAPLPDRRKGGG